MKLRKIKIIDIDIDGERKRINSLGFSKAQKKRLLKLCDMFEKGEFVECINFTKTWRYDNDAGCNEREFIQSDMWDILLAYAETSQGPQTTFSGSKITHTYEVVK